MSNYILPKYAIYKYLSLPLSHKQYSDGKWGPNYCAQDNYIWYISHKKTKSLKTHRYQNQPQLDNDSHMRHQIIQPS